MRTKRLTLKENVVMRLMGLFVFVAPTHGAEFLADVFVKTAARRGGAPPVSRVLDRNGVQLSRGMRVQSAGSGEQGEVVATVGLATALVRWDGADDDAYVASDALSTVSVVRAGRKRRS